MATKVQLLFGQSGQQKQVVEVQPDDRLSIFLERARQEWGIDAELKLRLFEKRAAGLSPEFVDLEQTFAASGLSRTTLVVEYAPEAAAAVAQKNASKQRELDEKQRADHERMRATDPVAAFRADLRKNAQTLEQVYTHADDAKLHRLFNTQGLLTLHNMVCGAAFIDPATATGINQQMFEKYGTCKDDGASWCSPRTRETIVAKTTRDQEEGVPRYIPKPATPHRMSSPAVSGGGAQQHSPPRLHEPTAFDSPVPASSEPAATPSPSVPSPPPVPQPPPPLTTIVTWFGEIIQPSIRHEELPSVGGKVVITAIQNVILKNGDREAADCDCELYIDDTKFIEGKVYLQPQLRYKNKAKNTATTVNLWPHDVTISDACCPSDASFSIVLKLDQGDVLMQFRSDSDVEKWERAIKHVFTYLQAFKRPDDGKSVGGGLTAHQIQMYREAGSAAAAFDATTIGNLSEGLVFSREPSLVVEESKKKDQEQDMESLLLLQEHNAFVSYTDREMSRLKQEFTSLTASGQSQRKLDVICKRMQELSVMNLELFKLTQDRNRWQAWLDDPSNARKAEWGKVNTRVELLGLQISKFTDEKVRHLPILSAADRKRRQDMEADTRLKMTTHGKSSGDIERALRELQDRWAREDNERIPFKYEDVLIQVGFDGITNGEMYTALCVLSKHAKVSDLISWLHHRVFDMNALVCDGESVPFYLTRNGVLLPDSSISSFASPPTAKIMCRVNVREPARSELPFRSEIRGADHFNRSVRDLFPSKKMTVVEENRIARLQQDQRREAASASFHAHLMPDVRMAAEANTPVVWRFGGQKGSLTCDLLRDYLNQGHFDDCSEYGKILDSYEFSFDAEVTWMSFSSHSQFLKRINEEAILRTLRAVKHTVRATVRAALATFKQPEMIEVTVQHGTTVGLLSFALPSLQQGDIRDSQRAQEIFQEQISLADEKRAGRGASRLFTCAPLSSPPCRATFDASNIPLLVTFTFPSFLNLDLIMRDKGGLQKELEHIIFNFYFEQKLALPRGGA